MNNAIVRKDKSGVDDVAIDADRCRLYRVAPNLFELEGVQDNKRILFAFKSGVQIDCVIVEDDFKKFAEKAGVDEIDLNTAVRFERNDSGVFWFAFYLDDSDKRVAANLTSKKLITCKLIVDEIGTADDSKMESN